MFDYLTLHDGPVVEETVYAKDQRGETMISRPKQFHISDTFYGDLSCTADEVIIGDDESGMLDTGLVDSAGNRIKRRVRWPLGFAVGK